MKGFILAAGKGSRLGDLTQDIPKILIDINGETILERQIKLLKSHNINEIGINIHTHHERIEDFLRKNKNFGVNIKLFNEKTLLGTGGAIKNAEKWLKECNQFILIYGDIVTNIDLAEFMNESDTINYDGVLCVHKNLNSNSFIKLNKKNEIIKFIERPILKPSGNDYFANSAIQILSSRILDYFKTKKGDLVKEIYCKKFNEVKLKAYILNKKTYRFAIDSIDKLSNARDYITKIEYDS